jgi:recombinational DNA repair ATPase RecF
MWIKSFEIKNFMSFQSTGSCELHRHITVVVGQNNVGKTALLRALANRQLQGKPYRSLAQARETAVDPASFAIMQFVSSGPELCQHALREKWSDVHLPLPPDWSVDESASGSLQFPK